MHTRTERWRIVVIRHTSIERWRIVVIRQGRLGEREREADSRTER